MTLFLAYLIAFCASVPTTLVVLGLWVLHARVVDGDSVDSVFLPFVFLLVPLIFIVSVVSNLGAVALGQLAGLAAPFTAEEVTIGAAGVLVLLCCAWTQRGTIGAGRRSAPVSALPVALFAIADMSILAGGLYLLPVGLS